MATTSSPGTMQAVVFKEPFKVAVEQRPIPTVQGPEDIIVKVKYTALCGRCVHRIMHPRYLGRIRALMPSLN
jgi:threonine dehydrogenase-like Zn-dependent dehydrogenase